MPFGDGGCPAAYKPPRLRLRSRVCPDAEPEIRGCTCLALQPLALTWSWESVTTGCSWGQRLWGGQHHSASEWSSIGGRELGNHVSGTHLRETPFKSEDRTLAAGHSRPVAMSRLTSQECRGLLSRPQPCLHPTEDPAWPLSNVTGRSAKDS